jgi:hypothetical protein
MGVELEGTAPGIACGPTHMLSTSAKSSRYLRQTRHVALLLQAGVSSMLISISTDNAQILRRSFIALAFSNLERGEKSLL